MNIDASTILAVILGGGLIGGIAAFLKSGKEADNQEAQAQAARAQAAATMIDASADVVALIRREMAEQEKGWTERHDALATEVHSLTQTVTAWDGWADRVIDLLDRTFGLLTDEQRASLHPDIAQAKESRPPRYRYYHDNVGKPHDGQRAKGEETT